MHHTARRKFVFERKPASVLQFAKVVLYFRNFCFFSCTPTSLRPIVTLIQPPNAPISGNIFVVIYASHLGFSDDSSL